MRLPRIWKRCVSGSARHCEGSGQRLSPSWRIAQGRSWDWQGGWAMQGTLQVRPCKLGRRIHAAHAPARPTRPAFDSFLRRSATEEGKKSRSGSRATRAHKQKGRGESRVLFVFHQFVSNPMLFPTVTGKLSGTGRCGLAGPLAPWMAPSSPHGWVYGVSCQPTPPLPTTSNPEPLWLWPLLSASARRRRTTARQRGTSTSNPIGQLTPVPPMPQYPFGFFARYCWW